MNTVVAFDINEIQLKKLAKNLRMLLTEHQVSENEVAQALGIPVMTVRRLASGETTDPRISTLKLIADYFKVSVDSLIKDNNPKTIGLMSRSIPQFIPILDWKVAMDKNPTKDLDLKSWKNWQPVVLNGHTTLSAETFALESRPSMQPRFPTGTLFIIDPKEEPNDGDLVLIKMKKNGDLSIRELVVDLPRWQLQAVIAGSESIFYDIDQHQIAGIVVLTMLHTKK